MILGPKKLLQLVKTKQLVEGLAERELKTPEGAGFDIRLGEVHKLDGGKAYLGLTHRETPKIKTVARYDEKKNYFNNNKTWTILSAFIYRNI